MMKRSVLVFTLLAGATAVAGTGFAAKPSGAPAPQAQPAEAPTVPSVQQAIVAFRCAGVPAGRCAYSNAASKVLQGFSWGMNHKQVVDVYNKNGGLFDQEANTILARLQNGSRAQQNAEAERDSKKGAFAASYVVFGSTPTGYDALPVNGEFSYRNKEAIQVVDHDGARRYFFFIGDPNERLYKVWEEYPLGEGSPIGKSFADVATKFNVALGVPGRDRGPDPDKGRNFRTIDWNDASTTLRLVDLGAVKVAVVLEERATVSALPQLRANKADDPFAIDPSIQAVTSGSRSDPNAARAMDAGAPEPQERGKKKKK
jgi:hypothetical protein